MPKIRRVKCDETKPLCSRCVKAGLDCDGYPDLATQKKKPQQPPRLLLAPAKLPRETFPAPHTISKSPQQSLFKNEQEHRYFRVFSNESAAQLSGYFDSDLWHGLVLQACESNSSIRHAVIAVGALDLATWKHHTKNPEQKLRRQFAYYEVSSC